MTDTRTETRAVWEQVRYESGLYLCRVEAKPYEDKGILSVTLLGNIDYVIHREAVKVERTDIDQWRLRCLAVINHPDQRTLNQ